MRKVFSHSLIPVVCVVDKVINLHDFKYTHYRAFQVFRVQCYHARLCLTSDSDSKVMSQNIPAIKVYKLPFRMTSFVNLYGELLGFYITSLIESRKVRFTLF